MCRRIFISEAYFIKNMLRIGQEIKDFNDRDVILYWKVNK